MTEPAISLPDWTAGIPRLVLHSCDQCGHLRYLPRERCDSCSSPDATPVPSSGEGLCVALTRLHVTASDDADPVLLTLVELDEGPIVMGRAIDGLQPGDRAGLDFRRVGIDAALVPCFSRKDHP